MMLDEFDIETLLEAPFRSKDGEKTTSHSKRVDDRTRNEREDRKDTARYSYRHRSRSSSRSRSHHSRDPHSPRRRSPSKTSDQYRRRGSHTRSRSPSRSRQSSHHHREPSPVRDRKVPREEGSPTRHVSASLLSEAQRDRRTVFCRQLAQRVDSRMLKEFCEQAGAVRDARIVYDKISRRSKGVAYVEFVEEGSVQLAIGLTGKKLAGIPIVVELTETEKNRIAEEAAAALRLEKIMGAGKTFAMLVNISNLHPSILEVDIRKLFQPFGDVVSVKITREDASRSVATIQFRDNNDARVAAEKMNGFELAGRPIHVTVKEMMPEQKTPPASDSKPDSLFEDHADDGTELLLRSARDISALKNMASNRPSPCLLLQHLYDPATETTPGWSLEIAEEVRDECVKFGRVEHLHIPKTVDGDVFVRFASTDSAQAVCSSFAGRWYGGHMITAAFIPIEDYLRVYPY